MSDKIVEVHPGIYRIPLPLLMRPSIINAYLIDCHGGWALIDTGMNTPQSLAALEEAFGQLGIRLADLTVLIGTHHHIDHFGASATLRQLSGAATHVHELELEPMSRSLRFIRVPIQDRPEAQAFFIRHGFPLERFASEPTRPEWVGGDFYNPCLRPDRLMRDGDVIAVGDRRFEVVWTPGHAPGHSVLYLRQEKVMIVGDHLLPKITPHVGIYTADNDDCDPLGDFLNSQLRVQRYDAELVLPAHGAMYHDHRHRAKQLIEHHRYREEEMVDLVRRKPATAFDVAQQFFGEEAQPIFQAMLATFETLAHLEHAFRQGRVRKIESGKGPLVFRAA